MAAAKLSWSVKEALRTQVQNLMREGELPTIHLGKNGLSHNFFVCECRRLARPGNEPATCSPDSLCPAAPSQP